MAEIKDIIDLSNSLRHMSDELMKINDEEGKSRKDLSESDKKLQDLLHEAEFSELSRKEKLNLLKNISDERKKRRQLKNKIELLEPCQKFINDNFKTIKTMRTLAEKLNNISCLQQSREYTIKSEEMTNLKISTSKSKK